MLKLDTSVGNRARVVRVVVGALCAIAAPALLLGMAPAGDETGAPASDQAELNGGREEIPIYLDSLRRFHVTSLGDIVQDEMVFAGDGEISTRGCNVITSWTDASFTGGTYKLQAGFAEQEILATSYTLPASEFPIKINLVEAIFATSNTIVTTTTKWSVLVWQGQPSTGTLVFSASSDGDILPHIVIPPGTNGVNLQFSIDPGDPDQIVVNDNGTHTFSVGFRIDDHNQQTGNGCGGTSDIPTNRNAFPVVDISGLAASANNWLKGVNCGPFGCPPNGGWASFAGLSQLCRPTGDWVLRATYSSVNCVPGVGACCMPDGACSIMTVSDCLAAGGTFAGDGSTCQTANCPQPTGACCFSSGFCLNLKQSDCTGAGGTWQGPSTTCNGSTCPMGACCLPDGSCQIKTPAQCAAAGGTYKGNNTTCATANCPQPDGACCFAGGFCLILKQADCNNAGGTWAGPNTTCVDANQNGKADVCDCKADFDGTGFVDFDDFNLFVVAFEAGDIAADFDTSGFVDFDDFNLFVVAYEAGC